MTYEPIPGVPPSRNPTHPRYRVPGQAQAMRARDHIIKMQRRKPSFRVDTSFRQRDEHLARALVKRKHEVTMKRRAAFLDLNAAGERFARFERDARTAKAMGREMNPERKQEDMQYWMDRYMATVEEQRAVFHPSF